MVLRGYGPKKALQPSWLRHLQVTILCGDVDRADTTPPAVSGENRRDFQGFRDSGWKGKGCGGSEGI